jgi:hypothetical protein
MSGRGIHIIFSPEGKPEVFFEADSDKETEWIQSWLGKNFIGARSLDPCGDSLQIPGAPSLAGREKENGRMG